MPDDICSVDGCARPIGEHGRRGLCNPHRLRQQKYGDPTFVPVRRVNNESDFWAKVQRGGPDDCWPWLGGTTRGGYGMFSWKRQMRPATHLALMLTGRPVPTGMVACHQCDNPPCVNPAHLFIASQGDNLADAWAKGRFRRRKKGC